MLNNLLGLVRADDMILECDWTDYLLYILPAVESGGGTKHSYLFS